MRVGCDGSNPASYQTLSCCHAQFSYDMTTPERQCHVIWEPGTTVQMGLMQDYPTAPNVF